MALTSFVLSLMVPRHPGDGHETVWTLRPAVRPAE
jgi:hypothetical protein